jgi:hypothetical protein
MPNENDAEQIRKQLEAVRGMNGAVLDLMVQVTALQFALADAGLLKPEEVQKQAIRLEGLEAIQRARSIYGAPSAALTALLQSYQGPVQ